MTTYRKPVSYRTGKIYRGGAEPVPLPGNRIQCGLPYRKPPGRAASTVAPWRQALRHAAEAAMPFGTPADHAAPAAVPWQQATPHATDAALPWGDVETHHAQPGSLPWASPPAQHIRAGLPWSMQAARALQAQVPWRSPAARAAVAALPWGAAVPRGFALSAFWRAAAARGALVAIPWGAGIRRQYRTEGPWTGEPGPGEEPITVPIRPVYVMLPAITAVILPDRTPLPVLSVQVRTDEHSYGWRLSASIPAAAMAQVRPEGRADPVQVEINVNGYVWAFAITAVSDNRQFGARSATMTGDSRSIALSRDYAEPATYIEGSARNASQIADAALAGSGWTLAWEAVDWLIPGGTYSAQDQAPIDELATLAGAIGARIETAPASFDIAVKPGFGDPPWAWGDATPYAIIPASILTTLSSASGGGRNADGIYVVSEGVQAFVKVTGSAGANLAPIVVDRLITHVDAAQERGRVELARHSITRTETVRIPLFPDAGAPGLIPVGALLEIHEADSSEWLGRVTAVDISGQQQNALSVRQTLTLDRYYRD